MESLYTLESPQERITAHIQSIFRKAMEEGIRNVDDPTEERVGHSDAKPETDIMNTVFELNEYDAPMDSIPVGTSDLRSAQRDNVEYKLFRKRIQSEEFAGIFEDSQNPIIEETVTTGISTDHKYKSGGAILDIENPENNVRFRMNDLLPENCTFLPGALYDLGDYFGTDKLGDSGFAYSPEKKGLRSHVIYGDISTNEGWLSALHEMAHAWQHQTHPSALDHYINLHSISGLTNGVVMLSDLFKQLEAGQSVANQSLEDIRTVTSCKPGEEKSALQEWLVKRKQVLNRFGVTFDKGIFKVNNPKIVEEAVDYVWVERHAWATALKVYEALKAERLIPEPEKADASQEMVHRALGSYQRNLNVLGLSLDKEFTAQ